METPVVTSDRENHNQSGVYGDGDTSKSIHRPKRAVCIGSIASIVIGVILVIIGIVWVGWFNSGSSGFVSTKLVEFNQVTPSNADDFVSPAAQSSPVPKFKTLYIFNVENPQDIRKGQNPVLTEKGPYNYQENVYGNLGGFSDDNTKITYTSYSKFEFQAGSSSGNETDLITSWNPGYLAVMSGAFQESVFAGLLLKGLGVTDVGAIYSLLSADTQKAITLDSFKVLANSFALGTVNCLDSFNAKEIAKCVTDLGTLQSLLGGGKVDPTSLLPIATSGAATGKFTGMFVTRTVNQWAFGFPSFVAGIATTASYTANYTFNSSDPKTPPSGCGAGTGQWSKLCQTPKDGIYSCDPLVPPVFCQSYCNSCNTAATVIGITQTKYCPAFGNLLKSQGLDDATANQLVGATCGKCSSDAIKAGKFFPFCLAPIPGALDNVDLSKLSDDELNLFVKTKQPNTQLTGTGNTSEVVSYYTQYSGYSSKGIWYNVVKPGSNPTSADIARFKILGGTAICGYPDGHAKATAANITCMDVTGGAGTAFPAKGASTSGLASSPYNNSYTVYISQANLPIEILYNGDDASVDGIKLNRFQPSTELLTQSPNNANTGIGFPVNGVMNLAFDKGFLAYVSYPYFLNGDKSLLSSVTVSRNGVAITNDNVNTQLEALQTTIDVEPASGATMQAHKRLMASFSVNAGLLPGSSQMDVPYMALTSPANLNNTKPFVVTPAYWVDENAVITSSKADSFNTIGGLAKATIPVTVVAIVVGVLCITAGTFFFLKWRAANFAYTEANKA